MKRVVSAIRKTLKPAVNRLFASVSCVVVVAMLFVGGCDAMYCLDCSGQPDRRDESLRTIQWQLVSFEGYNDEVQAAESTLRLKPDAATFEGKAACNSYGGRYEAEGERLSFDVRWITEIGCALNEYEYALIAVLDKVESYEIDGDTLVLRASRTEELQFKAKAEH